MIHTKEYDCVTREAVQVIKGRDGAKRRLKTQYCLTHKKYTCRCGKEWGKH